jgi:hypothetical protein
MLLSRSSISGAQMRTSELYQRYYGIYVGKVVSVEDP